MTPAADDPPESGGPSTSNAYQQWYLEQTAPSADLERTLEIISDVSNAQPQRESPTGADRDRALKARDLAQDIGFKKALLIWALVAASAQLLITNAGVCWYLGRAGDKINVQLLISWMAMALVEVIAIVAIIARYLFPTARTPDAPEDA